MSGRVKVRWLNPETKKFEWIEGTIQRVLSSREAKAFGLVKGNRTGKVLVVKTEHGEISDFKSKVKPA